MNDTNYINVLEMTNARDERKRKQRSLINKTGLPLLFFTLNIPGPEKDNKFFREIHSSGIKEIESCFSKNIKEKLIRNLKTGPEAYFAMELDPISIKEKTIFIEKNHLMGRIFDIDVIKTDLYKISRVDIKCEPRKCLICENDAFLCSRNRSHSIAELIERINSLSMDWKNQ